MTKTKCQGVTVHGRLCRKDALPGLEVCRVHAGTDDLPMNQVRQLAELKQQILDISDLEELRQVELLVVNAVLDGSIDKIAANAIAGLLKHQAELITKLKPPETGLEEQKRQAILNLSVNMPLGEAWNLMQNFTRGMAALAKKTEEPKAIEAEVKVLDGSENVNSVSTQGVPEAATSPEEIF